jgi:hypothetical protein
MSYNTEVLADSPLSRWSFEETSGTVIDDSQSATRDGTINGGVTLNQPAQLPGSGLGADFNGSSGYVSFSNASGLLGIGTIEVVASFDTIPASASTPLFSHAWSSGQIIPLVIGFNLNGSTPGKLQVGYFTGSVWVVATWASAPSIATPYHIVGKYDGAALKLRVNGAEVASTTVGTVRPVAGTVNNTAYLGRRWDLAQYHDGKIWDVVLYATALSDARADAHYAALIDDGLAPAIAWTTDFTANGTLNILFTLSQGYAVPVTIDVTGDAVQTDNLGAGRRNHISLTGLTLGSTYNLTLTPSNTYGIGAAYPLTITLRSDSYVDQVMQDGPVAYYPLQETSGTVMRDYSLGDHDGNLMNGAVVADTVDPLPLSGAGNHIRLDGVDDHLLFDGGSWLAPSTGFTFEGFFYFRSWSSWARVFDFANAASTDDMYLAANSSGTMTLKVNGTAMTFPRFPTGQWVHVAVTVTAAGAATVYQDGAQLAAGTVGVPVNGSRLLKYVGRSAYADPYLAASVEQVAVYNTALSAVRIQAHATEIVPTTQDRMAVAYLYADVNVGQGYIAPSQNAYFLADVNIGQNSPQNPTAFIESDAYVVARRFIGWGTPIRL